MTNETPKYEVGQRVIIRKQLWKITTVYGHRETYRGVVYAAVRWVKSTQKWSGNAYLVSEDRMTTEG